MTMSSDTLNPSIRTAASETRRFVRRAAQSAHGAVDRAVDVAQSGHAMVDGAVDRVLPQVDRLSSRLSEAGVALNQRADRLGEIQAQWLQATSELVRARPLAVLGGAFALGYLIARVRGR
jgi:hypothetical protein